MKAKLYNNKGELIRTLSNVLNPTPEDQAVTVQIKGKPPVLCFLCPAETTEDVKANPADPEDLGAEGAWVYREKK
jgi:hypothetical protein